MKKFTQALHALKNATRCLPCQETVACGACCLNEFLKNWPMKSYSQWKKHFHVNIVTRSLSCQDTVAFGYNDKTFI